MDDHKPIIGILKYGFYEQEIFRKERKEFRRTLRGIFKRHFILDIKDSEIEIKSDRWRDGVINWKNPTVVLSYKHHTLTFTPEDLDILYDVAYSNKFSKRFNPLEFFEYIRKIKLSEEEKALEKRRKRKKIIDGTCEYCGNTDEYRMEYVFTGGALYHKCTACR